MNLIVAPSLLSCDFARLADEVARVEDAGADWLHCDVMDAHFVPNLTFGPPVVAAIKKVARVPLDVHLMITDPLAYAEPFAKAGADILTFHVEAVSDVGEVIEAYRKLGLKVGLSISPPTPVEAILPYLGRIDLALVMTVNPGFGGQTFIRECVEKIRVIRAQQPDLDIEVDGGINAETALEVVEAGANVLVAGNYVFKSHNVAEPIALLREAGKNNARSVRA